MLLRIGLILLVLIAALPVLTVQVVSRFDARESQRQEIASTALRLAALEAERISRLVDIAHAVTATLVQLPAVLGRDGPECAERVNDLLDSLPQFAGIGAFAPDGTSFCRSGGDDPIFIGDRRYFQEALQKRRFVGSGHSVGRLLHEPVIVFAMPAIDDAGELRAVVLLDYPLSRLSAYLQTEALPAGVSVDLIDDDGVLMARLPASDLEREGTSAFVLDRLRAEPGGTATGKGTDGISRVFGYVRLPEPAGFEVVVGLPLTSALAQIDALMWRDLAIVAITFGIAALAAVLISEYGISRPIAALKTAAGRLARGDLAARARLGPAAAVEVAALAGSLNEMADAIAERERALSASEEFARRILASSQDCIEVLDLDGRLVSINAPGRKALEIDDETEILGVHYSELWDEDVPGEVQEAIAQARSGEAARFLGSLHTASGRQMWWDISISPIADAGGRPERLLVVSRDMTELKQAERHRELLTAELDHRVKNALAAIQSMARRALDPGRRADEFVERIAAMATVYSLLSSGRWEGSALGALVASMLAGHERQVSFHGPEVQLDAQTTQVLAVVMHELAANAARHGALRNDAGQVEIRWSLDDGDHDLRLEWREHGGASVEGQDGNGPGVGDFGFQLLRRSVEHELGGKVELDFRPDGLRCVLLLPLRAPSSHAERDDATTHEPPPSARPASPRDLTPAGGRVLVLEDSVLVAMEIEAVLAGAGYAVLGPAATVAEALQLMETRRVDAAVLDVNLGGGETSFPVAMALRDDGTPFIFLTGYSNRAVFPPELQAVGRVAKPFQERHLLDTLGATIARRDSAAAVP